MKIKCFTITFLFIFPIFSGNCQLLEVAWGKTVGTADNTDIFTDIIENFAGGYTVVGATHPDGKPDMDIWLVNFSADGNIVSSKTYGTPGNDCPVSISLFPGGELMIAGKANNTEGKSHALLIKTDAEGNEIWQKQLEPGQGAIKSVITFEDQSFNVCGTKTGENGNSLVWISGFSGEGKLLWEKTFGDNQMAEAESMKKLPDGGFVVAGKISKNGVPDADLWIFRFNGEGEKMWDKRIESPGVNVLPECVCCSPDNNIVVVGWYGTCMNDINSENPIFDYDLFLSKISPEGKVVWTKNIDSEGSEGGNAIIVRSDGKIVVAGSKETSFAGRVGSWLVVTDPAGKMLTESVYPLNFKDDKATGIINSSDGGLVIIGPGEMDQETKLSDGWIKKIKAF